jgi:phage head maturation protease
MNMTRREIFPGKVRIVDEFKGIADFVATSAAVDSYGEVVDPNGADMSRFQKNSPVIDSHDYSSVGNLLGKVNDTRLSNRQLIMQVQFAVDVPSNTLAQKAFAMVKAGYLRGCSIGFLPTKTLTRMDPGDDWEKAIEDLDLEDQQDSIRCIYRAWQLLELSICCIGANPDAVAKSYRAGIISDSDLASVPSWKRALGQPVSAKERPKTLSEFFKIY